MATVRAEVSREDVLSRIRNRLSGGNPQRGGVVWTDRDSEVLVLAERAELSMKDGWVLIRVPMTTRETGRRPRPVGVAFFVGRPEDPLHAKGAATLDTEDPTGLLSRWGEHLQSASWDGLLDAVESARKEAAPRERLHRRARPIHLVGFSAAAEGLVVEFRTGDPR